MRIPDHRVRLWLPGPACAAHARWSTPSAEVGAQAGRVRDFSGANEGIHHVVDLQVVTGAAAIAEGAGANDLSPCAGGRLPRPRPHRAVPAAARICSRALDSSN